MNYRLMKEMYHEFRYDIDDYAFPLVATKGDVVVKEVRDGEDVVGFLLVDDGYVDCLYVRERYRRKGLAGKAVREYVFEHGLPQTIHIVNSNHVAQKFWKTVFKMDVISRNEVDTFYAIRGLV